MNTDMMKINCKGMHTNIYLLVFTIFLFIGIYFIAYSSTIYFKDYPFLFLGWKIGAFASHLFGAICALVAIVFAIYGYCHRLCVCVAAVLVTFNGLFELFLLTSVRNFPTIFKSNYNLKFSLCYLIPIY